jgi:hypothetical protein
MRFSAAPAAIMWCSYGHWTTLSPRLATIASLMLLLVLRQQQHQVAAYGINGTAFNTGQGDPSCPAFAQQGISCSPDPNYVANIQVNKYRYEGKCVSVNVTSH